MRLRGAASERATRVAVSLACAAALVCAPGRGLGIDPAVNLPLPSWDIAVGLTGGVAFDELDSAKTTGALFGVDVGLLHGLLGLHVGLRTHREGYAQRLGGLVEVTAWYVLLLGMGIRFGAMLEPGGPGVPDDEVGLTFLVALPLRLARLDEGRAGALVIAPYARPGLRFEERGEVSGFHEIGVMLRWTSFGY